MQNQIDVILLPIEISLAAFGLVVALLVLVMTIVSEWSKKRADDELRDARADTFKRGAEK